MKIWIDGYEANVPQRLGSSQIAFELLRNLEKIDKKNEYTILLPSPQKDDLPKKRDGWNYRILKPRQLWTRIALPLALYLSKDKPDVFFTPTHYIPRFSPIPRVCIIFDLSFLHFPEMFLKKDLWQLKNWTKYSAENADHIIAISNATKEDIVESYKVSGNRITVVYPGYDKEIFKQVKDQKKIDQVLKKYNIKKPYLIYIGTIQPRKNLVRFIKAFSNIISQGVNVSHLGGVMNLHLGNLGNLALVIVGKTSGLGREGWKYEEILKSPKELGIEERVIFTGFVPTKELPYLLSGATAFILPSLWEGFGIPVLEAMASGCPVIVSNVSSLPEVVGSAGLLIDPYSVDQIEQATVTMVSDESLRQKYQELGLEQAKKFSWEKMAKQTLEVFEKLASHP